MMPTQPMLPLIMIAAQLLLQFPVIQFDAPTGLGDAHHAPHVTGLRCEGSQPILHGLRGVLGPLHQQPLSDPRRVLLLTPSMGCPDLDQAKLRALRPPTPLTPGHMLPNRCRHLVGRHLQVPWSWQGLQRRILAGAAGLLGWRQRQVRILGPHARTRLDLDNIRQLPLPQRLPNPKIIAVVYQIEGALASAVAAREALVVQHSCFILATNELNESALSPRELLEGYKGQKHAERGFGFLKDPLFLASSLYLKKP
jgi:hypothetical protein